MDPVIGLVVVGATAIAFLYARELAAHRTTKAKCMMGQLVVVAVCQEAKKALEDLRKNNGVGSERTNLCVNKIDEILSIAPEDMKDFISKGLKEGLK